MNLLDYDQILRVAILEVLVAIPMIAGYFAMNWVFKDQIKELREALKVLK